MCLDLSVVVDQVCPEAFQAIEGLADHELSHRLAENLTTGEPYRFASLRQDIHDPDQITQLSNQELPRPIASENVVQQ